MNGSVMNPSDPPRRHIFSVSELTEGIKELLESAYPFVWVTGEISNLHYALSGHCYFTLKDAGAQIGAVMFRGQTRTLKFKLEDGLTVISMGRLNVYEAKGVYQLIMEYVEPAGLGALQLAFQQLKERLEAEGLFRQDRKAPLPLLPRIIAVITSPRGAAIHDIFSVIQRRFPNVRLLVAPVSVQGADSPRQIVDAISLVNRHGRADLIILARGGGSLEDLQAFNSETVARAVSASAIPVVSGVGHETDLTIADMAADVRAATPSAAAELAVPERSVLEKTIARHTAVVRQTLEQRLVAYRKELAQMNSRLVHPGKRVAELRLRLDEMTGRIYSVFSGRLERHRGLLTATRYKLSRYGLKGRLETLNVILDNYRYLISSKTEYAVEERRNRLSVLVARLNALNPLAVLERGYSVTRRLPDFSVLTDTAAVAVGADVSVLLSKGEMVCTVKRKRPDVEAKL